MSYCHTCSLSQPFCDNCDNVTGFSIYTRIYVCALLIPFLKFLNLINNKKLSRLSPVTIPTSRKSASSQRAGSFQRKIIVNCYLLIVHCHRFAMTSSSFPIKVINIYKKTEKNAFSTFSLSSISLCRVSAI